jgi:sugar phosphate permease
MTANDVICHIICVLFCLTAALFSTARPSVLMTLYFLSNFFSNFGANTTMYVMSAETYPTKLRGTCHGLSAFLGKLGALTATIAFGMVDQVTIFWICGSVSAVGIFFTLIFSCDLNKVSLAEHDAQFELFLAGHLDEYKGLLNTPQHLSNYELWTKQHDEYGSDSARSFISDKQKQ